MPISNACGDGAIGRYDETYANELGLGLNKDIDNFPEMFQTFVDQLC